MSHKILFIVFIVHCCNVFSMYIPANTRYITPEDAEVQVKTYFNSGLTVPEGLLKTLRDDENNQLKIMLDFLDLDLDKACKEIQRVREKYKKLKPEKTNAYWHINLARNYIPLLTRKLKKHKIDPSLITITFLNNNKIQNETVIGSARLTMGYSYYKQNNELTITAITKPESPVIKFAKSIHCTTLDHECFHIQESHGVVRGLISNIYKSIPWSKRIFKKQQFLRLKNNLILSQENAAEQNGILEQINTGTAYRRIMYNILIDTIKEKRDIQKRPDNDHLSPLERYIATCNMINLLEAEQNLVDRKEISQSLYNNFYFKGLKAVLTPSSKPI